MDKPLTKEVIKHLFNKYGGCIIKETTIPNILENYENLLQSQPSSIVRKIVNGKYVELFINGEDVLKQVREQSQPMSEDKQPGTFLSLPQGKVNRPKIVCLCGSSRFVAQMAVMGWLMEKEGAIVLGLHLLPQGYPAQPDHQAEAEGVKEKMDNLHKRKIDLADEVFIYNEGGYIGESTRSEIEYATAHNKPITYLEKGE